ncbi:MAG: FHA domain-containing protein [Lachnospiraceae bacterium]|nr:FHA domain-containing protein [Lachnospiraceae bacterium]
MKKMSFLCCKRYIALIVSLVLVFVSVIFNVSSISATESDTEEVVFEGYNASESIVQVVLLYQDTNSVYHILQSGSGILIEGKTVITNNHLTYMSDTLKTEAGAYLTEKLGYDVSFVKTEDSSQNVATYSIAIVQEADIYNIATVALSSNDWDFAVLSLSSQSDKTPAVLGNSENVSLEQEISTIGLPSVNYGNAVSFTAKDVITTNGKCVNLDGGVISFDARLESGSSGGALVDKYGRVMGITTYKDSTDGTYCALPINNIKGYLERSGVVYIEDDKSIDEIENATTEEVIVQPTTDKNELNRVIMEAQLIYDEGNDGVYTEESFRDLNLNLEYAKITYEDPMAPQTTIDSDTINLRNAIDNLKKVEKKSNVPLIVAISVGGVILVALIVVLIVVLVKKGKKNKAKKKESQQIKTLPQANENSAELKFKAQDMNVNVQPTNIPQPTHIPQPTNMSQHGNSSQLYSNGGDRNVPAFRESSATIDPVGTTLLAEVNPGTTILTNIANPTINGFMCRTATGENIFIDGEEFIIGKVPEYVDYVVKVDTVSRKHAKITRKYDDFFIEDLGSTNFSYLNGERIAPGDKKALHDGDVIYLSDVEFVFRLGC